MNNELVQERNWLKRNWKWFVPVCGVIVLSIGLFSSSGMGSITSDFAQAYADNQLYENALEKVKSNQDVIELLGQIEPIDKLTILEGEVRYSNNNNTVNSSVRIIGTEGRASMDISAYRANDKWIYTKINVRIRKPPKLKQTIIIN